jgi:hypothetical protein
MNRKITYAALCRQPGHFDIQRMSCSVQYTTYKISPKILIWKYQLKCQKMAFQGKYPICSKMFMYNNISEQVSCFQYLGDYVRYENEKGIAENLKTD